ncbi:hypothetical protein AMC79_PD00788 (plasmid) [Rhizobium phaseoli]|nr:hypothetical protein AMC88_PD00821 [Rhizobium phaseoli]ANL63627.1 hypothetical protein AMC85_PD00822 [Rhizobium phaseoli]ANM01953.1 hypothetical protein AMC79_PD00788 [Rhizobium phaseoli]
MSGSPQRPYQRYASVHIEYLDEVNHTNEQPIDGTNIAGTCGGAVARQQTNFLLQTLDGRRFTAIVYG